MNLHHRINFRCDDELFKLIKENYNIYLKSASKHISFGDYIRCIIRASLYSKTNEN